MYKDPRYRYVKSIWKAGDLSSFAEMFGVIPKSIVANDIGMNYERFAAKVYEPQYLSFREVLKIALLAEIEPLAMVKLVLTDLEEYIKVEQENAKIRNGG
jgi:hypothetical protein